MKKIINPYLGMAEAEGYNCFACAPHNEHGLHMEFYEDGDEVVCYWSPAAHFQGWTDTLHGGIQATLIDETAGWVIARKMQTSGMTTNLNIKYKRPIPTGEHVRLEIRARICEMKRMFALMQASIMVDGEGNVLAQGYPTEVMAQWKQAVEGLEEQEPESDLNEK